MSDPVGIWICRSCGATFPAHPEDGGVTRCSKCVDVEMLTLALKRADGALADAATVPTGDVERGIRLLTEERDRLKTAAAQALDRLAAVFKVATEERWRHLRECERESETWRAKGDMWGWNFHQGRAAGANWCDLMYQRVNREIETIRKELGA